MSAVNIERILRANGMRFPLTLNVRVLGADGAHHETVVGVQSVQQIVDIIGVSGHAEIICGGVRLFPPAPRFRLHLPDTLKGFCS
jgi:hypothetical protein